MWVGVGLASVVLLPYPRFLRKHVVNGLEILLTRKFVSQVMLVLLTWAAFLFAQAFLDQKDASKNVIELKAQKELGVPGVSGYEMDKAINQMRMIQFYSQRNVYLAGFTLTLYFVVFTYIYSLKRYDELHDTKDKLEKDAKKAGGAVPQPKK